MSLLEQFYTAFANRDHATMSALYHPDATFSDPVFPDLDAVHVAAMWKMLLTSGTDLRIEYKILEESATAGKVHWEAWYTFSKTGRAVHNIIEAEFTLENGLILFHTDRFDLWRWSRQGLGVTGWLLGWSPIVRNKVQGIARASLNKAIAAKV